MIDTHGRRVELGSHAAFGMFAARSEHLLTGDANAV
jgi:hypothetical protein